MQELNIITPIYRPSHVPAIYHSVETAARCIKITWWPVFDKTIKDIGEDWRVRFFRNKNNNLLINTRVSEIEDPTGYIHKNGILDILESEMEFVAATGIWVYFLDDNNIFNSSISQGIISLEENVSTAGFPVSLINNKNEKMMSLGLCFQLNTLRGLRFIDGWNKFYSDWFRANNEKIVYPKNVMGYYNNLD